MGKSRAWGVVKRERVCWMVKRIRLVPEIEKRMIMGGLGQAYCRPPKEIPVIRPVMERMLRSVPAMSRVRRRERRGVVGVG